LVARKHPGRPPLSGRPGLLLQIHLNQVSATNCNVPMTPFGVPWLSLTGFYPGRCLQNRHPGRVAVQVAQVEGVNCNRCQTAGWSSSSIPGVRPHLDAELVEISASGCRRRLRRTNSRVAPPALVKSLMPAKSAARLRNIRLSPLLLTNSASVPSLSRTPRSMCIRRSAIWVPWTTKSQTPATARGTATRWRRWAFAVIFCVPSSRWLGSTRRGKIPSADLKTTCAQVWRL
jgi:hypothetical protein